MAISQAAAAGILEHYIRVALNASGVTITEDMSQELTEAVAAFEPDIEACRKMFRSMLVEGRQKVIAEAIAEMRRQLKNNPAAGR